VKLKDRVKRCLVKKKEQDVKALADAKFQADTKSLVDTKSLRTAGVSTVKEHPEEEEMDSEICLKKTKSTGSRYILK